MVRKLIVRAVLAAAVIVAGVSVSAATSSADDVCVEPTLPTKTGCPIDLSTAPSMPTMFVGPATGTLVGPDDDTVPTTHDEPTTSPTSTVATTGPAQPTALPATE